MAEALKAKFGERYIEYRRDYQKSLDGDLTGFLPSMPITVGLELLNKCNFKCIMCLTPKSSEPKIVIADETIDRVLAECKEGGVPALMFGMGEEPLLHKGFLDVLERSNSAGIMDVFLFTNGLLLNERIAKGLVEGRIARVYVSIDAATPETFKRIRGSSELEKIEENVKRLVSMRDAAGAVLPVIRVSFCIQPGNLSERQAFIDKWKDVVDHVDIQEMHDFSQVTEMAKLSDEERFRTAEVRDSDLRCHQPWEKLTIWANGDVSPCCTFHGKNLIVGNIQKQSVREIWTGEKIDLVRRQISDGRLNPVCRACLQQRDTESFES